MTLDDESGVFEEPRMEETISASDLKKDMDNHMDNGHEALPSPTKAKEQESSMVPIEVSETISASKHSKGSKGSVPQTVASLKINKPAKEKERPTLKGSKSFSQSSRKILSQSLSFPARRASADVMNKSIDKYPIKVESKSGSVNGSKIKASISDGSVSSKTQLNHPKRAASIGGSLKEVNTSNGRSSSHQRSSLPSSLHGIRRSMPEKSGSDHATICPPSEVSLEIDQNSKPVKTSIPGKEDDDTHSNSCGTPHGRRSLASSFGSRLDERAEKRKEFFTKLEEKIQAKEVEKTNLQAISKESQEAEIKQMRKGMAFKASPMPNFYKEPPPKVELKKIPTTRPKSPKLGRPKSTAAEVGGGSSLSPRLNGEEQINSPKPSPAKCDKETTVTLKKLIRKSQTKLQSHESSARKNEANPPKSKPKNSKQQDQSLDLSELNEQPSSTSPEIMPPEIAVGC